MKKAEDTPEMRVLKTATCKSITGKSTLTYQIGCNPESVVHLRISKNTGAGFFSDEWISFDGIQEALKKRHEGQAITSYLLAPLFKGKSVNTPSFMLAALKHLKLVQPLKGKQREHESMDPKDFLDQVETLMSTEVKTGRVTQKTAGASTKKTATKTATKKAAIKIKSTARRKTSKTV